jgi:tetratricopeptide (TPR) repeat protein/predicted Ser/Thr protein kinase
MRDDSDRTGPPDPRGPADRTDPSLEMTQAAGETLPGSSARSLVERGEALGRYVVLEVLGRGGMGVVYAAYDPELDRKVALKVLQPDTGTEGSLGAARLLREAQAMAKLAHPNVIAVHDVGTVGQDVFVAMEFVSGATLEGWRRSARRPWREIIAVFVQAGRGLEAAHRAGLVHRDFKPDNVIVGDDGRVRVMDFGLARPTASAGRAAEAPVPTPASSASSTAGRALLVTPITMTGALMGTPAYMAPEQHLGQETDARADQFAFCVALYETLWGRRPFAGDTLATLAFQVVQGDPVEPPRDGEVPPLPWRVIRRGLARLPADRWPSMTELLAELERRPAETGRRWLAVAGLAAVVGGGAVWAKTREADPCAESDRALAKVWDEDTRAALSTAFSSAGLSFAGDAWSRTAERLDEWAGAFVAAHRDACEATRVRGEQSGALLDRRMACLSTRRAELEGLLDSLAAADPEAIARAPAAAAALSSVAPCNDLAAMMRTVPPPDDPELRARVEAIEVELAHVKGIAEAGQYARALPRALAQIEAADATEHAAVRALARHRAGLVEEDLGDSRGASEHQHAALGLALEAGDDELAAQIVVHIVAVDASSLGRYDQADSWLDMADAWARRFDDDFLRSQVLNARGLVLRDREKLEPALATFQRALELAQESPDPRLRGRIRYLEENIAETLRRLTRWPEAVAAHERAWELTKLEVGPQHPDAGNVLNSLAMARSELGELDRAEALLKEALAIREAVGGRENRDVAATLSNLGTIAVSRRDFAQGKAYFTEALDILIRTGGREQLFTANVLNNLGLVEKQMGAPDAAIARYEESLAIERELLGDDSAKLAVAEMNMGVAYSALDRMGPALEHTRRAVELARDGLGEDHPHTAVMTSTMGIVLAKMGRHEEALAAHGRARELLEPRVGAEHVWVGYAVQGIGDSLLALGRPAAAVEPLEAALKIRSAAGISPQELGEASFSLAQALWRAGGDRARALTLAAQARDAMTRAELPDAVADIDAWIEGRS